MLFMFLSLFVATSWIQVVDADALGQNSNNKRTRLDSYEIQRGSIIVDGVAIASSVPSDDMYRFQRVYTDAPMWESVTGWFNPALQSATGIEQALNTDLSGTGSNAFFAEIERIVSGQPQRGFSVELTLNTAAQQAAYDALQGLEGAVVAIEPKTGRILAMVSTPGFDTNTLATHDADAANAAYDQLVADPSKPLYNRAIAGNLNPPGSTFKIVVAAAAFASGDWTPESTLPNPARYQLPQSNDTVSNAWGGTCGEGDTVTIAEAIRLSCNIPMAELAVELGDDAIRDGGEVRLQPELRHSAGVDAVQLSPRPRRPADRAHRLRSGQGHRDPAADRDGRRGAGERRSGHEPAPGRRRDRQRPVGRALLREHRVRHRDRQGGRRRGDRRHGRERRYGRGAGCKNRRGRRGRKDRDRGERKQSVHAVVHRLRAGGRPGSGGSSRRRERRR
jgi:cell division protein FtsI/penicillin-binding protein 2